MQWQNDKDLIFQILRFVAGFTLLIVGIRMLGYDQTKYLTGTGFVIWGAALLMQTYLVKIAKPVTIPAVLQIVGSLLTVAGFVAGK